jgi:hypothetical protein
MNKVEGYIEDATGNRSCDRCRWHVSFIVPQMTKNIRDHYCSYSKQKTLGYAPHFIGTEDLTPHWCPVGKAVLPSDENDC